MDVVNSSNGLVTLQFLTGPLAGRAIPINKPIVTIGREPTNDISVPDPQVSRQHARLVYNSGQWLIEKIPAQNTISVNSRDVQQSPIANRDIIALGTGTTFVFLTSPDIAGAGQASLPPAQRYVPPPYGGPQSTPQQLQQPGQPAAPAQQPFPQP
ncbi:MAG TPA: FHA domain-containing protein, partial [Ktedonobacteraceae bacterium]|nr:FHA domain-containing protein [Ktedonobacteraceae bacterium]